MFDSGVTPTYWSQYLKFHGSEASKTMISEFFSSFLSVYIYLYIYRYRYRYIDIDMVMAQAHRWQILSSLGFPLRLLKCVS